MSKSESYLTATCVFINSEVYPTACALFSTRWTVLYLEYRTHGHNYRQLNSHTVPLRSLHGVEYIPDEIRNEFAAVPI